MQAADSPKWKGLNDRRPEAQRPTFSCAPGDAFSTLSSMRRPPLSVRNCATQNQARPAMGSRTGFAWVWNLVVRRLQGRNRSAAAMFRNFSRLRPPGRCPWARFSVPDRVKAEPLSRAGQRPSPPCAGSCGLRQDFSSRRARRGRRGSPTARRGRAPVLASAGRGIRSPRSSSRPCDVRLA